VSAEPSSLLPYTVSLDTFAVSTMIAQSAFRPMHESLARLSSRIMAKCHEIFGCCEYQALRRRGFNDGDIRTYFFGLKRRATNRTSMMRFGME
jgi:hypothetical protein